MLAQLFATILSDRYQSAIDNASTPADLDRVSTMVDDAEERGALAGEALEALRERLRTKKAVIGETSSDDGNG